MCGCNKRSQEYRQSLVENRQPVYNAAPEGRVIQKPTSSRVVRKPVNRVTAKSLQTTYRK